MKKIRILYTNFWYGFDPDTFIITRMLKENYDVELCKFGEKNIDLVIMSVHDDERETFATYTGKSKILWVSFENLYPDFNRIDYAITTYNLGIDRNLRYTGWQYYDYNRRNHINKNTIFQFENQIEFTDDLFDKRSNELPMVISNGRRRDGIDIIVSLFENFTIRSSGRWRNNVSSIGPDIEDKIRFFNSFKFSLAFENSLNEEYVTEKLYESFVANTIPIYFGCEAAKKDFNPKAYINVLDYGSADELCKVINEIMFDKERYKEMITQKRIINYVDYDIRLKEFLINIIENGKIFNHKYGALSWYNF